jgi:hypothetical protein
MIKALTFALPIKQGAKVKPKRSLKVRKQQRRNLKILQGNVSVTNSIRR